MEDRVIIATRIAKEVFGHRVEDGWMITTSYSQRLPDFSSEIGPAWEVVEKMQTLGFAISITHFGFISQRKYRVSFRLGGHRMFTYIAKDVPLAICMAALKVMDWGVQAVADLERDAAMVREEPTP